MQATDGFRGTCTADDCHKQRYSQGLCQIHYREAGLVKPSVYPECATAGCANRSRGRRVGSLCQSCRRSLGDVSVLCETEGCANLRSRRGLCRPCFTRDEGETRPYRRKPNPKREQCERPGCKLRPNGHHSKCGKHRVNFDACVVMGCAQPIVNGDRCDKHWAGGNGRCLILRCDSPRFKAQLCYRHHRERNPNLCARKGCPNSTTSTYCRTHDVGIDFAAGDWHDWVAVEQLWDGSLNPKRKPTVPELEAVFDRAERKGMGYVVLAHQLRVDQYLVRSWCDILGRLRAEAVAA